MASNALKCLSSLFDRWNAFFIHIANHFDCSIIIYLQFQLIKSQFFLIRFDHNKIKNKNKKSSFSRDAFDSVRVRLQSLRKIEFQLENRLLDADTVALVCGSALNAVDECVQSKSNTEIVKALVFHDPIIWNAIISLHFLCVMNRNYFENISGKFEQ